MRRREFITLIGGTTALWPLAARAQPAGKVYRIGYLGLASAAAQATRMKAFREGLAAEISARNMTNRQLRVLLERNKDRADADPADIAELCDEAERRRQVYEKRCHGGPCEYATGSYDNGNVTCRNCGESAEIGCRCDQPPAADDCEHCHYELDGGGYLSDTDQPRSMHCRHCGRLARIS